MSDIITVTNLTKEYKRKFKKKQNVLAVNTINFSVEEGEIFGFLGRNGAGKSTTIKILTGQLYPSSGSVSVCGIDPMKDEKELGRKIGVVPELPNLYKDLSLKKNLYFFARLYSLNKSRADELIEQFDLSSHQDKPFEKLSKGLKQKVLLARAILHSPDVLFLDEPTSGLDPNNAVEMKELIVKLKSEGKTIFITTHNMNVAETLCDRIAIMKDGDILALDTPKKLKQKYSGKKVVVEYESETIEYSLEEFSRIDMSKQKDLISLHSIEPTLEEVFIKITEGDL